MDKRDVPWAEGRRALVRDALLGRLLECVAAVDDDGREVWLAPSIDDCGEPDLASWWIDAEGAPTALLPGQCPECYEVGEHADGCRVAVNLAAGVPEFWAQWAHFEDPAQTVATVYQWSGCDLVRMHDAANLGSQPEWVVDCGDCEGDPAVDGRPWVAIGLDGAPTNEPWEG